MPSTPYPAVAPPGGGTPRLPGAGQPGPLRDGEFAAGSTPGVVSFGFDKITPPSLVYIQRDDLLVLQGSTTLAGGDTLTISIRLLNPVQAPTGQPSDAIAGAASKPTTSGPANISNVQQVLKLPNPGVLGSVIVNLQEGYLLSVAIISTNATAFGQTYASAFLGRGSAGGATPSPALMLVADYPTSTIPVGWPGIPIRQTSTGQGAISDITIANPSAGTNFTFTANVGLRTRIHSVTFLLTTSATATTRTGAVAIADPTANVVAVAVTQPDQPASLAVTHSIALGLSTAGSASALISGGAMPQVDLLGNWTLKSRIANLQAGDQISAIVLELETWVA